MNISAESKISLVQLFNFSVLQEINKIKSIFDELTQKKFELVYKFDHNQFETKQERAINQTQLQHCPCLIEEDLNAVQTSGFGIQFLFQFLDNLEEDSPVTDFPGFDSLDIQSGGGSGLGFQVYCEDTVILTAGGGSGGGFYFNGKSKEFNFGAGGGAGIQFADFSDNPSSFWNTSSNLSFHSVGAGGGCGTCERHFIRTKANYFCPESSERDLSSPILITCGFTEDDDALDPTALQKQLRSFKHHLATCPSLTIHGGGGGGGGTSRCCRPGHFGYGFSFTLSLSTTGTGFPLHHNNTNTSEEALSDHSYHISPELSPKILSEKPQEREAHSVDPPLEDVRYQYDFIGKLLHDASHTCPDLADWCCLCRQTQLNISSCIKEGKKSLPCEAIRENYQKISWLVHQHCCPSQEESNESTSATLRNFTERIFKNERDHSQLNLTALAELGYRIYSSRSRLLPSSLSYLLVIHLEEKNNNNSNNSNNNSTSKYASRYHRSHGLDPLNLFESSQLSLSPRWQSYLEEFSLSKLSTAQQHISHRDQWSWRNAIEKNRWKCEDNPHNVGLSSSVKRENGNESTRYSYYYSQSLATNAVIPNEIGRYGLIIALLLLLIIAVRLSLFRSRSRKEEDILQRPLSSYYPSNLYGSNTASTTDSLHSV